MSKVDLRITNLPKEIHPECEAVITHYGVNLGKLLLVDIIAAIHSLHDKMPAHKQAKKKPTLVAG